MGFLRMLVGMTEINGQTSDGYHTFDELYHHRTMLFASIIRLSENSYDIGGDTLPAWKSKHHSDGSMFPGMFIVGIETPDGQCNYHVELKYWDIFECRELTSAPIWDGHTPEQGLQRLYRMCKEY